MKNKNFSASVLAAYKAAGLRISLKECRMIMRCMRAYYSRQTKVSL
ncbi:MAG: hypothetical protein JWN76_1236 [Chitinophagaceae bacterium]|nr:hypothetical protein [Chitinophagaceae bacterium]